MRAAARILVTSFLAGSTMLMPAGVRHALALSELKGSVTPAGETPPADPTAPGLPLPDPLIQSPGTAADPNADQAPTDGTGDGEEDGGISGQPEDLPKQPDTRDPNITVLRDIDAAPARVREMRARIVEAAASGDLARLVDLMGKGSAGTRLSGAIDPALDRLQALREMAADPEGLDVAASVLNILSTGFVHVKAGTPDEAYVWPYFAEKPMSALTPPEKVELMRIVTAGDVADMQEFDGYNFFRIGIAPDGTWKFFTYGE